MKTILASLAGMPGDHAVLRTAGQLARMFDGHVDALYVYVELESLKKWLGAETCEKASAVDKTATEFALQEAERRKHAHAVFDEMSLRMGLPIREVARSNTAGPSIARIDVDSLSLQETVRRARFYDVAILARERQLWPARIADVILGSGRPVLVPGNSRRDSIGHNIAITWKPCPEAARAVTMAAPFLADAQRVTLLVAPEGRETQADVIAAARPLQESLAWRGLQAEILAIERAENIGMALQDVMYTQEFDLVVMGAYSHSRLRESILGGVTRTFLDACDIPVLMAH